MRSAALLPTPGDPFLVKHWLTNYARVWRGEVDELRVLVNRQPDDELRAYLRREVEAVGGVYTERNDGSLSHGACLNILIQDADADVLVLVEDDTRVRTTGAVGRHVEMVASGRVDVVGSPRVSMSPALEKAARERWGIIFLDDISSGHGMWPAFVFARRADLLETDRDYGGRSWGRGMTVPGLRYVVEEDTVAADTFGGTAFQLRDRLRVHNVEQWKGPWLWERQLDAGHDPPWFHIGSLSSSENLASAEPLDFGNRALHSEDEKGEWAHRLHWWNRCVDVHGDDLPDVAARYRANLECLREAVCVEPWRISAWAAVVDRMVTWQER